MAKKTFESALQRLEQITEELEAGDLNLDKSLKMFDEGVKLVKYCNTTLEEARSRVELLINDGDQLTGETFTAGEDQDV
jgi:exodeoxyribonuclease VII small subunit